MAKFILKNWLQNIGGNMVWRDKAKKLDFTNFTIIIPLR